MKLQVPFIQLPLRFDAEALAAEIAALGEAAWKPHPQGFPGNSMLPLVAVDGDPDNASFAGAMGPTSLLDRCPYLANVIANFSVTVGRTRLMRLAGQAEVTRHADQGYYWTDRVRVHVPIVTQPTVRFECGDAAINMKAGECWIFDTWRQHRVLNDATESRIHLVCDTVGGSGFWELVSLGRSHDGALQGWQARDVLPGDPAAEPIRYERINIPEVMTPWEMQSHFGLLFADARPHPQLNQVSQITMRFMRAWQALWAQHGASAEGKPQYQAVLDRFLQDVAEPSRRIYLENDLLWYNAMTTVVGKFAAGVPARRAGTSAEQQRAVGDNA